MTPSPTLTENPEHVTVELKAASPDAVEEFYFDLDRNGVTVRAIYEDGLIVAIETLPITYVVPEHLLKEWRIEAYWDGAQRG